MADRHLSNRPQLNRDRLDQLLKQDRPENQPRISLFMPTHRRPPNNEGDPIRFKNLVTEAEKQLQEQFPRRTWEEAIRNLRALHEDDPTFLQRTRDGIAVLASGDQLAVFHLLYQPEPAVFVTKSFHILSLLGYFESYDECFLAEIGTDRVRLYVANRYGFEPYFPENLVTRFHDLFDDFDKDADLNFGTYGGAGGATGAGSMYHGHRTRSEMAEKDRDKYFKYLDEAFTELHKTEKRPVLLAGTSETLGHFHKLVKGKFYLAETINQPLDSLEDQEIQERIREAMDPMFQDALEKIQNRLRRAESDGRIETRVDKIEAMAKEGRVDELIVDQSRILANDVTLDDAILHAVQGGTSLTVLSEGIEDLSSPYTAILRY